MLLEIQTPIWRLHRFTGSSTKVQSFQSGLTPSDDPHLWRYELDSGNALNFFKLIVSFSLTKVWYFRHPFIRAFRSPLEQKENNIRVSPTSKSLHDWIVKPQICGLYSCLGTPQVWANAMTLSTFAGKCGEWFKMTHFCRSRVSKGVRKKRLTIFTEKTMEHSGTLMLCGYDVVTVFGGFKSLPIWMNI